MIFVKVTLKRLWLRHIHFPSSFFYLTTSMQKMCNTKYFLIANIIMLFFAPAVCHRNAYTNRYEVNFFSLNWIIYMNRVVELFECALLISFFDVPWIEFGLSSTRSFCMWFRCGVAFFISSSFFTLPILIKLLPLK